MPPKIYQYVLLNEKRKTPTDRTENCPFFRQNRNPTNKQLTRNQPHYSEDEEYFHQNQLHYKNIPRKNNWKNIDQPLNIYQPDNFEPYMSSEQTRQTEQPLLNDKILHNQIKICNRKIKILKLTQPIQSKNSHYQIFYNNTKLLKPNL